MGVKQGCVLAPVIFNLFLVAVTLVFRHNISAADGVLRSTIRRRRCPAQPCTRWPAATAGCNLFCILSRKTGRWHQKDGSPLPPLRFVAIPSFLDQRGSTWPHWTVHVPGKYHYFLMWSHCGDSAPCFPSVCFHQEAGQASVYEPWPFHTHQDGRLQRCLRLDTALCMWGMDTLPSSHQRPRGLSHSLSSNYPARALVGQNTSRWDSPQSRHNIPGDDTTQKTTEVTWPCDKDAWKQTSPSPNL